MKTKVCKIFSFGLCICLALVSLSSCKANNSYTLLVYMCGSNLETYGGNASKNIEEILASKIPSNVNVIIQTGGAKAWQNYDIPSDKLSRYIVKNKKLELLQTVDNASMGDEKTLSDFISYAKENYPANETSLILWDHGGGCANGICFDEVFGYDGLTLGELNSALKNAGTKFNFIGMDACLMATIDTVFAVRDYADYLFASEDLEPSAGWDYESLLKNIRAKDFNETVLNSYIEKNSTTDYLTLSVTDLSGTEQIQKLYEGIEKVAKENPQAFGKAFEKITAFGKNDILSGYSDIYDIGELAKELGSESEYSDVVKCVNGSLRNNATGLSLYFPIHNQEKIESYVQNAFDSDYADLLYDYFDLENEGKVEFTDRGFSDNNCLKFSVSKASLDIISSVKYELYQFVKGENEFDEQVYSIGTDNDVTWNNTDCRIDFEGRWVFLDGNPLCVSVAQEKTAYTVFFAQIELNERRGYLIFTFDKNRKVKLQGFSEDSNMISRTEPIKDGDKITVLYHDMSYDYHNPEFSKGKTVTYNSENTNIVVSQLPNGYYQYYGIVTDIFGNNSYTNIALVHYQDGAIDNIIISDSDNNALTSEE